MKKQNVVKVSLLTCVLLTVVPVIFLHFSGCVAIPEQPYVIRGADDLEAGRSNDGCNIDTAQSGIAALDPDRISVISWNSHKGSHVNFSSDLEKFADNMDFFLLQEAAFDNDLKKQLKTLNRQWLMTVAFELGDTEIGLLSASRVPAGASCAFREPEPLLVIPKMILAGTYPIAGINAELLVVNIHMVNFTIGNDAVARQVNGVSELITNHRGPVIVAGDFNTWSEGRESAVNTMLEKMGLKPVLFEPDNRTLFLNKAVDGIYFRGLEPVSAETHVVDTSDHNPLEVVFKVMDGEFSS